MEEGFGATMASTMCGRWNPTTEQVKVLMELFNGTQRTTRVRMIGTHEHHQSGL